ncbi:ferritin-like domain-containing protein [Chryseolinea sp. T2]|uniref:YciE/YciF ferroxidase family protein n=1 Tax=Chryseolinea sp. T2 TaxID=3129255 RepID=UPI0030771D0C
MSKTMKRPTTRKSSTRKTAARAMSQESDAKSMLQEFLVDELKDIYWAEKHLTKALPKMAKAASSEELREAFENHLSQTEEHVSRLEQVFEILGMKPMAKKCDAMAGLVEEGKSIIEDTEDGTATRDVGLIMAAQKVEHYEIATYGGLAQLAKTLGLTEIKDILGQTLSEEKETDELLTEIAENHVNVEAAGEDE